jgi:hypothetical protein
MRRKKRTESGLSRNAAQDRFFNVIEIRIITIKRSSDADRQRTETVTGDSNKSFRMMVARDGVEPPTPAFSGILWA